MKKRLISVLLTVLMVMSLFSGMSLSAYADNATTANTMQYQMVNGDNVFMICQKLGLNFYDCKAAIMKLNGITDGMWSKLPVGKVLTLPATNADGIKLGSGGIGGTTVTTGSGANTNTAQVSASFSDPVAYYLIPYTMSRGETVAGVCNQLGINFNAYSEQIKKINDINNWTKVAAGSTLLLPSLKAPAVGTSCYAVLAHKVASGETAYSIANSRGVSYGANTKLLKSLNNTNNLNDIKTGDNFYVPVATTIAPNGTATGINSGSSASSGSSSSGSGSSSSTTSSTAKKYKLSSNITSSSGSLQFYVNNQSVVEAAEGATVTVVTDMKSGKAVKSMTIKHANGKADVLLSGNSFIMPACDVRVDVEVSSGHNIKIDGNYANKAVATLGGIAVTAAAKDSAIIITSADPTYEVVDVKASYKKLLGSKVDLPITSNGFVMPDANVNVTVTLKPVTTYDFFVNDTSFGSFYLQVNGGPVSKAAKGAEVTIVHKAQDGYTVTKMEVKTHDSGKTINVFNNTFTMPAEAVDVNVEFGAKGNNILIMPAKNGTAVAKVDGNEVDEADTGATVKLEATPEANFKLDHYDVVRNSDGYKVNVSSGEFTMPAGGVTVTPVFTGSVKSDLKVSPKLDGSTVTAAMTESIDLSVFTSVNGAAKTEYRQEGTESGIANGDVIDLSTVSSSNIAFIEYNVYVDGKLDADLTNQANMKDSFEMPAKAVTIEAVFESGKIKIGPAAITGSGTVSFKSAASEAISACKPGDAVTIVLTPSANYTFNFEDSSNPKDLTVTRKDTGAKMPLTQKDMGDGTFTYTFNMPADGVDIVAVFRKATYTITMSCFDENGADLTGTGIWQIQVGSDKAIVDNEVSYHNASFGDKVVASMTEAGKSAYAMVKFQINGADYTASVKNYAYNFAITGDRAKDPNINIVATVRLSDSGLFTLTKNINDMKRGNVNFLITASPSGYSTVDGNYDEKAYSGDTVAIIPSSVLSGYAIDEDHISIVLKDGGVIHPTPVTIDGQPAYEFVMPSNGYSSLKVNFYAEENPLKIHVKDSSETGTDITNLGLVYVMKGSTKYSSVLNEDAVGSVAYKTTVKVILTEVAKASGWKWGADLKITTPAGVTVKKITDGYQFEMPAELTDVIAVLTGGAVPPPPPTPVEVTLPSSTKDSTPLSLQYYKDASLTTIITDNKAMSGDTVYVKVTSTLADGQMLKGGIEFKDESDGSGNVVASADNGGSFVVSEDIKSALAPTVTKQYQVKITVKDAPSDYTIKVDGMDVSAGSILTPNKEYGKSIGIVVTGDRDIESVSNLNGTPSGKSFSGTLEPAAEVADGDVVEVMIVFHIDYKLKLKFVNDSAGTAKVEVNGAEYQDGEEVGGPFSAGDTITFTNSTKPIRKIEGLESFTLDTDQKGGNGKVPTTGNDVIDVTVTFEPQYKLSFKFVNNVGGSNTVKVGGTTADESISISPFIGGEEVVLSDSTRKIVKVTGLDSYKEDSDHLGGKGKIPASGADGSEKTLTIEFQKLNYNLKLQISGAAAAEDNAVRLYSASNPLRSDGHLSGPYYVDEVVPVYAPEGYHFKSISSPVISGVNIDSSDAWHSASFTIAENSSYSDGDDIYLTIVLEADPS